MLVTTDLVQHTDIGRYKPKTGDIILWHGWVINKWYGIVEAIDANGDVATVTAGIPFLLFHGKKKKKIIKLEDIQGSANGEYSIFRSERNIILCFV